MPSNFGFVEAEWPGLFGFARDAEVRVRSDPRAACWYARLALESTVAWLYDFDSSLQRPFEGSLNALLHEPTFKELVPQAVWYKAREIQRLGNKAAHEGRPVAVRDAMMSAASLFHVLFWVAATYGRAQRPDPGLRFDEALLPQARLVGVESLQQLQQAAARAAADREQLEAQREHNAALQQQLEQARAELAAAKAAAVPDSHDYDEDATRHFLIDEMLAEAGWQVGEQGRDVEFPVLLDGGAQGYVDYVLWGADGLPLGLVEAKRTRRDARAGKEQARRYADALEAQFGRRPVVFYSNGYDTWLWDDASYPPRQVHGFYTAEELQLLVQRRTARQPLAAMAPLEEIADRYYQVRAIRRVCETFEADRQRRALLVMATGTGKTRTVIGLVELLMRAGWAKRVLFLADRTALVRQAVNAFKKHLPDASPVNLVTERSTEGRVYVSTYPTMLGLLEASDGQGRRRFGAGFFDLIVIDEAHRSIFRKYRAILEHFDAKIVGLTATPKDEVDRSTYSVFGLQPGVPTDAYSLEQAVADGFLVPFAAQRVPLKFVQQGIRYDELSSAEQELWDELEWDVDHAGGDEDAAAAPDRVEAAAVNSWLFNADTVDKVLAHLMEHGHRVAGGDQLAKTIVFAKNRLHAEFIVERFDAQYPHLKGSYARTITSATERAQSLLEDFTDPGKDPQIAVSVDMLDTGVDVPEVANLVFFKIVRSKTKFWQMIGRGTRLRPDLYGPGRDKQDFRIFDFMGNFDFFGDHPQLADSPVAAGVSERRLVAQVDLVQALNRVSPPLAIDPDDVAAAAEQVPQSDADVRDGAVARLVEHVRAIPTGNVTVRPHLRAVEQYRDPAAWADLGTEDREAIAGDLAPLPAALPREGEEAKQFDLLIYRAQLKLLERSGDFEGYRRKIQDIAAALEPKSAIPMVAERMELILDLREDTWWHGATLAMLEQVRRALRGLVQFIDRKRTAPLYTDFEDTIGPADPIDPDIIPPTHADGVSPAFRQKATAFLFDHLDHPAVVRLHTGQQLTADDIDALQQILIDSGTANPDQLTAAAQHAGGLGLFIRSLVGLDRGAAKELLGQALGERPLAGDQLEFLNLIVDSLTEHGRMPAARLYESPFTDYGNGPEALFGDEDVDRIIAVLRQIEDAARVE